MKGEHSGRERARSPLVQRALVLTRGGRTRHRPRLGAMSTSLLDELMTDHLDPGYAAAARRREAAGEPAGAGSRARAVLAIGLLLVRERDAALAASRTGDQVSTDVRRLEAAAAQSAVHGPGVEVVAGARRC